MLACEQLVDQVGSGHPGPVGHSGVSFVDPGQPTIMRHAVAAPTQLGRAAATPPALDPISTSRQATTACSGGWVDGSGGRRPAPASGADRSAAAMVLWQPSGAVRSPSAARTAGCLGERTLSPGRVMPRQRRSSPAASPHAPRWPATGRQAVDSSMIPRPAPWRSWPPRGNLIVGARLDVSLPASCWTPAHPGPFWPALAESAADPPADPAATLRIGDPPPAFWPHTAAGRPS